MVSALLVCTALVAASPELSREDQATYDFAKVQAGRDPEAQVKLALWCEAHGLKAERMKHLAIAVLNDPRNAMARGLIGMVAYNGRWERPDAIVARIKQDDRSAAALAAYNSRRARTKNTADEQWKLALWCEDHGLTAEATAHLAAVTRLDPSRDNAWKRMGYKKHSGRWLTDSQWEDEKTEREAQAKANKYWRPLLAKWRGWMGSKTQHAEAERLLATVTDPRAVPSIWTVFATGTKDQQKSAVQLLGQVDGGRASRALAMLSLLSGSEGVRRASMESLARRDPREYAGTLIVMLRDPIKYEVRPVGGPGLPGILFVEGKEFNLERLYSPPPPILLLPNLPANAAVSFDLQGLPVITYSTTIRSNSGPENWAMWRDFLRDTPSFVAQAESPELRASNSAEQRAQVEVQTFLEQHGVGAVQLPGEDATPAFMNQEAQRLRAEVRQSLTERQPGRTTGFGISTSTVASFQLPIGQLMIQAQQTANQTAMIAEEKLRNDVASLDQFNATVNMNNDRIGQVLRGGTAENLEPDRKTWTSWLVDQLGYRNSTPDEAPRPTIVEDVPLPVVTPTVATPEITRIFERFSLFRVSCFGAGTLVATLQGPRAIETLEVGDQVLAQNIRTGALGYRPILVVFRNPPSKTLRISLKGETIVSSEFHRFWVAGRGWVMARALNNGDTVRVLGGLAQVDSIETGSVQPVFNLDVADDADFFVGQAGILVHDNTIPDLRLAPFDAAVALTVAAERPN